MARSQFTFTFTNAQPGSVVSFDDHVAEHLYAAATGSTKLGRPLVLNSSNSLSVWTDVAVLTATTEDGAGNEISATATVAAPSVTTAEGTPGQNPYSAASSASLRYVCTSDTASTTPDGYLAFTAGNELVIDAGVVTLAVDGHTFDVPTAGIYVIELAASVFNNLTVVSGADHTYFSIGVFFNNPDPANAINARNAGGLILEQQWGVGVAPPPQWEGSVASGPVAIKPGEEFYVYVTTRNLAAVTGDPALSLQLCATRLSDIPNP